MQAFRLDPQSPNVLAGGKRPRTTLTPTVVLKDGQPFLAIGTPGGDSQDQQILLVLLNMIDFGRDVQAAIEAPRVNSLHPESSFDDHRAQPGVLEVGGLGGRGGDRGASAPRTSASHPPRVRDFDGNRRRRHRSCYRRAARRRGSASRALRRGLVVACTFRSSSTRSQTDSTSSCTRIAAARSSASTSGTTSDRRTKCRVVPGSRTCSST